MEDTTLIVRNIIVGRALVEIWQMLRGRSPCQDWRKSSAKKLEVDLDCPNRIEATNVVTVRRGCRMISCYFFLKIVETHSSPSQIVTCVKAHQLHAHEENGK